MIEEFGEGVHVQRGATENVRHDVR
jgi:hypothetical protein